MNNVILFRGSIGEEKEFLVASKALPTYKYRAAISWWSLVVGRYSVLPYYQELEQDLREKNSRLVNSYKEHQYAADIQNWYYDLEDLTPKTWFYLDQIPDEGPFVLKGATNSKKFHWRTHMYAENKKEAIEVYNRLCADEYIGSQTIYIREFVKLNKLTDAPQGLPISEEYRFFVLDGKILSGGFYWSSHIDDLASLNLSPDNVPKEFLNKAIDRVKNNIPFFTIDVARLANGGWTVIEINDGQMSGLSENDPTTLYSNMKIVLQERYGNV